MKSGDMNSLYFNASGMWWDGKYRAIAESLLNIIGNFILVKLMGIYGVILATVISITVGHFWNGQFLFKLYYKKIIRLLNIFLFRRNNCSYKHFFICVITFITTKFIPKSDATKTFIFTLIITGVIATTLFSFAYIYMSKALNLKLPIKKQYSQKGQ
ncbi:MAG: polysaccharide biosynthesis C-terminal domain-containing protein [Treponema succinifaciens]|nr:MAG: polysaccharide biosynthesis C-terminal domain-containing protein [Treponema succinifaciens]